MSEHRKNNFLYLFTVETVEAAQNLIHMWTGFGLFGYIMNYPQFSVYYFRAERNKNNGIRCLRRYVSSFTKC